MDGVKQIVLSGLRATVIMKEDQTLDKEKLAEALKARKLELVSLGAEAQTRPTAVYALDAAGAT